MLGAALPALDLSSLLQFVFGALLIVSAAILVVKRSASRYFVVDCGFEGSAGGRATRSGMIPIDGAIGDGDGEQPAAAVGTCAVCGNPGSKTCSRCKTVRYCSQTCQAKHWKVDHKHKCKQPKPSDEVEIVSSGSVSCRRRKPTGFNSISLVPARGTVNILQEPKKILFPYDEFLKLYNWSNPGFPPCGLVNCGNSCFANVVLQCLACTRPLIAYLLERNHNNSCNRDDWCFLCELQEHIRRVSVNQHPFSPLGILSRLPNIGGNLGYGRQEDAHEFMRFAIDTMQSVCLNEFGGEKAIDFSTQETTLIQYIFGGHLQSQVTCTACNMVSNRYENMMDLTVEIQGDVVSLEECLEQFTVKEWLDGDNKYKCDGCNDYVRAWKRLTVHQAPNILTVALKRFQGGRFGKLNKRVTFPESLDLTPYMSGNSDGTDKYTLYAVVVHVDMLNASFFGHYICYTKDSSGQWYRIDDCKVIKVEVEDVLSESAYMLLYSRKTARKEPFVKPLDPQGNRQTSEGIQKLSSTSNIANPVNVSSPPLYVDKLTSSDENNESKLISANTESPESIESSKMVVNSPAATYEGSAEMGVNSLSSSSQLHKDYREGHRPCSALVEDMTTADNVHLDKLEVSTQEVRAEDYDDLSANSDVSSHLEDNGSCKSSDASTASSQTLDASIATQNGETDTKLSFTSLSTIKGPDSVTSEDLMALTEQSVEICNASESESAKNVDRLIDVCSGNGTSNISTSTQENDGSRKPKPVFSGSLLNNASLGSANDKSLPSQNGLSKPGEGNRTLPLHGENSISKQKPLFSRGFLDKSTKTKPVAARKVENRSNIFDYVPKKNGYSNGETDTKLSFTSLSTIKGPDSVTSEDLMALTEQSVELCNASESESAKNVDRLTDVCSGNGTSNISTSTKENGGSRKPKPVFSGSILNNPSLGSANDKSLPSQNGLSKPGEGNRTLPLQPVAARKVENRSNIFDYVPKENGYSNGETDTKLSFTSLSTIKGPDSVTSEDLMALTEQSVEICNASESESAKNVDRLTDVCSGNGTSNISTSTQENGGSRKPKPVFSGSILNNPSLGSANDKSLPSQNGLSKPGEGNRTLPLHGENGISKQKPLFSRGFLDKPTKTKPVAARNVENRSNIFDYVPKENGYSNGLVEPPYDSKDKNPCGAHSNGLSLHAGQSQKEEEFRQRSSLSNGFGVETSHGGGLLDPAFLDGAHEKDESLLLS